MFTNLSFHIAIYAYSDVGGVISIAIYVHDYILAANNTMFVQLF